MRVKTIEVSSYHTAKRYAPWAAVIARISQGFIAFESVVDYRIWKVQR